jgi:hypothetical protein
MNSGRIIRRIGENAHPFKVTGNTGNKKLIGRSTWLLPYWLAADFAVGLDFLETRTNVRATRPVKVTGNTGNEKLIGRSTRLLPYWLLISQLV